MPFAPKWFTHARSAWNLWSGVRTFGAVDDIQKEAERPFSVAVVGSPDHAALLVARLALETPTPRDGPIGPEPVGQYVQTYLRAEDVPDGALILDADQLTADEATLARVLARLVVEKPNIRLSLARHIPAFRPAVTTHLIAQMSWTNAKLATLSALPGIIPLGDVLLPAAAVGDMFLLTKNQITLLLQIAAAYGMPVDLRARMKELLPVVGSGFGWRAAARELVGLVPGGVGIFVKGCIAYSGTYTVGKAAAIYYSTGRSLSTTRLKQLYRDAWRDAATRLTRLVKRDRAANDLTSEVTLDLTNSEK